MSGQKVCAIIAAGLRFAKVLSKNVRFEEPLSLTMHDIFRQDVWRLFVVPQQNGPTRNDSAALPEIV